MAKKIIILLLLVGGLLRFWILDKIPAGLHSDEAQAGYNAFLLLKTGKNLTGQAWPLDIDSFGDYRPALISYLTIPSIAVFGLSEFSTRAPVAIFGTLLILLTYKFSLECFQDKKTALVCAALLAISPMAVIFSRATSEAVLDVFFELFGLLCLIFCFKRKNPWFLLGSYLFWLLAYFSYHLSRVLTVPLVVVTIFLAYRQFKPGGRLLVWAVLAVLCYSLFPWAYFFRTPLGQGRASQVSVFTFPEVPREITQELIEDGGTRLFHNKATGYALDISARYLSFFSPNLILFSLPKPDRYFAPWVGAVTAAEFLGLLLALGYFVYKKPKPLAFLPLVILLLAPLPSAVTFEDAPNFQRAFFLVPAMQMVAGLGLAQVPKKVFVPILFLILGQSIFFIHQYFVHQSKRSYAVYSRTTEMKSVANFLIANQSKKILLSEHDAPYLYYLFYNQINIFGTHFQKISSPKYFTGDYKINNLTLSRYLCLPPKLILTGNFDVFIINDGCPVPPFAKKIIDFRRSDGTLASAAFAKE